jgi:hypothetical protein
VPRRGRLALRARAFPRLSPSRAREVWRASRCEAAKGQVRASLLKQAALLSTPLRTARTSRLDGPLRSSRPFLSSQHCTALRASDRPLLFLSPATRSGSVSPPFAQPCVSLCAVSASAPLRCLAPHPARRRARPSPHVPLAAPRMPQCRPLRPERARCGEATAPSPLPTLRRRLHLQA